VAMKKRWPVLTAVSIAFTVIYEWAWVGKFLTASQLPLAAGIFLTFAATSTVALWVGRADDRKQRTFDVAAIAGAALPLLFAIVGAAVPAYGARYNLLFAFLLLISVGLSIIGIRRGPGWLHLAGGITAMTVFVIWSSVSYRHEAWPVVLAWLSAFVVVQVAAAHLTEAPSFTVAPALFLMFPILIG